MINFNDEEQRAETAVDLPAIKFQRCPQLLARLSLSSRGKGITKRLKTKGGRGGRATKEL